MFSVLRLCETYHFSYINPREYWAVCILARSPEEKLAEEVGNFGSFGKANEVKVIKWWDQEMCIFLEI